MKTYSQVTYRILSSIVLLIFFGSITNAGLLQDTPEKMLIGEWSGKDQTGRTASYIFNADHSVKIIMGNMVLDGSTIGGKLIWKIDAKQNPIHLDIDMKLNTGQIRSMPQIIRFVGKNKLQIRKGKNPTVRPVSFSEEINDPTQIILVKQ